LLAVLAISSTFVVFAAITVRWSRGRRADRRIALGSTLWGMTVAPAVALALELVCATALIAGGALGLYIADAELLRTLSDGGIETAIEDSGNDLITMPTLILGIAAVYAVIAPLVEEFAKLLASVVFLRPADATQFDAFTAGVFAGLGFASVETLAYALAAGDQWPLLAAIRAPVAIIHVSAAAFAALGWYAGELSILRGYAMAALIHAGWNGLTVTVLLITAAVDDPESLSAAAAFATLVVFGAMTLLLTACSVWLVKTARKRGRETSEFDPPTQPSATIETSQKTERNPTIGRATLGS
jgi:RsiW-degrading membrane proteinase PrsW (M82 family)